MEKIDASGFMHKEIHLKKMGNFMHRWILSSIQSPRRDLDTFAAISTFSRCQEQAGCWIKGNNSS